MRKDFFSWQSGTQLLHESVRLYNTKKIDKIDLTVVVYVAFLRGHIATGVTKEFSGLKQMEKSWIRFQTRIIDALHHNDHDRRGTVFRAERY